MAQELGVSVGKVNYLIKALLQKGHIRAGNFMRAQDKIKYAYLLTPEGLHANHTRTERRPPPSGSTVRQARKGTDETKRKTAPMLNGKSFGHGGSVPG